MNFTEGIRFGDVQVESFEYLDTTGISGVVPPAAYTSEIFLETDTNILSLGEQYVVLDSASQVSVGELETYSGKAGDLIQITGDNFYQITDVRFGHSDDLTGQFFVTSPNEINVIVPSGAEWEGISVSSSLRTGLNGSTSESSGISPNEFVIIPEITGLSTGQQTTGQNIDILGRNFNAVTGANLNNVTGSVSLVTSSAVRLEVPSGDVWGGVNLLLKSGLSHSGDSSLIFKSLAKITGIGPNPASGPWSAQTIPGESELAFVETGDYAAISGLNFSPEILYDAKNFDLTSSGYLVGFGTEGSTGLFNLVGGGNNLLTGKIPTSCPTGQSNVFLYSNHYPEAFPSDVDFLLKYSVPEITSISPSSGLAGDVLTVKGKNFYDITGADITGGAVGAGTEYSSSFLVENKDGDSVTVTVGNNISSITTQQGYDVVISGRYGEDTSHHTDGDGFVGFGLPTVTATDPTANISPNQTGTITGTNLYSGDLRLSLMKDSISNVVTDLALSGFKPDNTEVRFTYPNSFETGKYRLRLHNVRGSTINGLGGILDVYQYPVISGFTPLTGVVDETTVTVSGAFQAVTGLRLAGETILPANFVTHGNSEYTTGIQFTPAENIFSDKIEVLTSGGNLKSPSFLSIVPGKPKISGFWVGGSTDKPNYVNTTGDIDYEQVFYTDDTVNISGERMNLVTGVEFSGQGNKIIVSKFTSKNYNNLTVPVPEEIYPYSFYNNESGKFNVVDSFNRTGSFPSGLNITEVSGFDNYLLPGEELVVSGVNVKGMRLRFNTLTGARDLGSTYINTIGSIDRIKSSIPTGINVAPISISGRKNSKINTLADPLAVISAIEGISGQNGSFSLNTGSSIKITGSNFFFGSGFSTGFMAGYFFFISGTGWHGAFEEEYTGEMIMPMKITGYETGTSSEFVEWSSATDLITLLDAQIPAEFIGTGHIVLTSPFLGNDYPWMLQQNFISNQDPATARDTDFDFLRINSLERAINYFPDLLTSNGTHVDVTSFGPNQGITGTVVRLTGQGFSQVHDVGFQIGSEKGFNSRTVLSKSGLYSGIAADSPRSFMAKNVSYISDSVMEVTVPAIAVTSRTKTNIILVGGTGKIVKDFEILLDNQALVQRVIDSSTSTVPQVGTGQVAEYTVEETIGGAIWYVTYKKYPDGTKSIVNSFPKAEA